MKEEVAWDPLAALVVMEEVSPVEGVEEAEAVFLLLSGMVLVLVQ